MPIKKKSKSRGSSPRRRVGLSLAPVEAEALPAPAPEPVEWLPLFLLSLYAGCYYFTAIVRWHLGAAPGVKTDYPVFVSSWALVPALSLASAYVLHWLKKTLFPQSAAFFPALLALTTAAWAFQWAQMPAEITAEYLHGILVWVPAVGATSLLFVGNRKMSGWPFWPALGQWAVFLTPVAVMIGLRHFDSGSFPAKSSWMGMLALAGLATWLASLKGLHRERPAARWLGLVFLAGVILLLFSMNLPRLTETLKHHQNFYLGPANDIVHGKSMLVDVNCQYGVGVIYFLALFFKTRILGIYYTQLSFFVMILWILQYAWLYWALRNIVKSQWLLIACMLSAVLLERFGYYTDDNLSAPSVGPLRFGLPLWVMTAAYLRKTRPSGQFLRKHAELILMGAASLWSFETFVYTVTGYVAMLSYESWADSADLNGFRERILGALLRLGAALLAAHALFAAFTLARSGQLPAWSHYFDYIRLYGGASRFCSLDFPPFSPWIFMLGTSFLSVMASCFGLFPRRDSSPATMFVFGLTVVGVFEFTYFLGRSHPDNISHVCFTTVIAAFYWLDRAWSSTYLAKGFKWACTFSAMLIVSSFGFAAKENIQLRFSDSLLGHIPGILHEISVGAHPNRLQQYLGRLKSIEPEATRLAEFGTLMQKYLAPGERAALFISPATSTETLLCAKRSHLFPISNPEEDSLLQANVDGAVAFAFTMKAGDIIFASDDETLGGPNVAGKNIGASALAQLKKLFRFELIELSPTGIRVIRLAPPA